MKDILTVSQLNDQIKASLEDAFDTLWVEGEVSNLRRPGSGHTYFTLKDDKSQMRAVFFRPFGGYARARTAAFELEEGASVLCRARLGVYAPRGEYQLIVESVEPLGLGALQKAFEQLKAKLAAEGLFDECHKKPLPYLPSCIGVVTSPTGSVIRDILHVTRRRFSSIDILIAPTRVQGAEAAGDVLRALSDLERSSRVDVIIIARGGGSLEDLAPFNDEALARAIFACSIPVVSAVGHETDYTLCDFVGDMRAPTPSAAAELVAPCRTDLVASLVNLEGRLLSSQCRHIETRQERLSSLQLRFKDPRRFLADYRLRLDELRERLERSHSVRIGQIRSRLETLAAALGHMSPARLVEIQQTKLAFMQRRLQSAWDRDQASRRERLALHAALLDSLGPLKVLQRGYAMVRRIPDQTVVTQASAVCLHDRIGITLADGDLEARVEKISGV